jgi:hypothetical protein
MAIEDRAQNAGSLWVVNCSDRGKKLSMLPSKDSEGRGWGVRYAAPTVIV